MSKNNVVHLPLRAASTTDQSLRSQIKGEMEGAYNDLFRKAVATSPYSPQGRLPQYGPWEKAILYKADGSPIHLAASGIDRLRLQRPFTTNAIEMRCDALGLAVYVSGHPELDPKGIPLRKHVRMVVYLGEESNPRFQKVADTAGTLIDKLHEILVHTYNELARAYCLAGFPASWLTLTSAGSRIPDIPISMNWED